MRRGGAGLLAAVLALAGCKHTSDPKPPDREPVGTAAGRAKKDGAKDAKQPSWLEPIAKLPGAGTGVPKAGDPNLNSKNQSQDAVGGKVVDAFNRPAKDIFIRIENVNDPPGAAALGIKTDGSGYFFSRGLKPGQTYTLTAEATLDGKPLFGTVQTRVPNAVLTIVLREDAGLPPPPPREKDKGDPPATEGFPPPPVPTDGDYIPPMGLGSGGTGGAPRPTGDGAYTPGGGATRPVPATIGGSPVPTPRPRPIPTPGGGPLPEPDDLTRPVPGSPPERPENVAGVPPKGPFTPPAASIPGGPPVPPLPTLPGSPGTPDPKGGRGRTANSFKLLDSLGRAWDFSADRSGSAVLVEFVSTNCAHCKTVLPVMTGLQSQYGASGLQVVAVLCDELPPNVRQAAAGKYARDNNVNFAVFVEPGAKPGAVRDSFGVEAYPTAVLLDAAGKVLWKGHPKEKQSLEAAVRKALGK
jgi:thiol-disulfide isomerase/thioredoxin